MGYQPQYYDSNIYMQSTNLILKAADMYYNQGIRQQEISEKLEISISTVSRLLKKAKEQEIVRFTIDQKSGMSDTGDRIAAAIWSARGDCCTDSG